MKAYEKEADVLDLTKVAEVVFQLRSPRYPFDVFEIDGGRFLSLMRQIVRIEDLAAQQSQGKAHLVFVVARI